MHQTVRRMLLVAPNRLKALRDFFISDGPKLPLKQKGEQAGIEPATGRMLIV